MPSGLSSTTLSNPHYLREMDNAGHVGGIKEEIDFPGNRLCLFMPDPPMVCVGRSLWIHGACLTVYAPGTDSVCMGRSLWVPGPRGLWPPKSRASKNDPVQGKKNTRGLGRPDSIIESKLFSSSPRPRPSPPPRRCQSLFGPSNCTYWAQGQSNPQPNRFFGRLLA